MDKNNGAIYDARKLGKPKMIILGVQHMFAMFGATILVPILTGLDISTTLLMAGLGTLLFHCITKFKVPAFLGSSFAFLGGYAAIKAFSPNDPNSMLPYACLGVACAGLIYFILAAVIKAVGIEKVMRFFPPVVTGPIIIAIGLGLAPSAVSNCTTNWFLAVVALAVIIVFNIWGKGMAKIIPIILGLLISYGTGLVLYFISQANPDLIQNVPWLFSGGRPFVMMPDSVMNIVGLDYAITSNGAVISKCGKTVHRSLILPDDVLKILGAVRNDDVILEGFIDGFTYADVRYVHRPLDYGCEPEYFEYTRSCHGKIVDMRSFLSKHRNELDLISIISTDEKLRNRLWSSIEKACNSVEITTSTDHFVEIMSAEASKAKALLRLCDFLNIGMENVCACGNADNDADMIAESGLGAAVENASQKCLDRADIVIPSNNNDGVAQLIEKILKN